MISAEQLTAAPKIAVPAILALAREKEAGRTERLLAERDVDVFLALVQRYPKSRIVVYAERGTFVPQNYPGRARVTTLEFWPAKDGHAAGACVSEADAHRPRARGAWCEVDGRREF